MATETWRKKRDFVLKFARENNMSFRRTQYLRDRSSLYEFSERLSSNILSERLTISEAYKLIKSGGTVNKKKALFQPSLLKLVDENVINYLKECG